jgi:hypothetical protein
MRREYHPQFLTAPFDHFGVFDHVCQLHHYRRFNLQSRDPPDWKLLTALLVQRAVRHIIAITLCSFVGMAQLSVVRILTGCSLAFCADIRPPSDGSSDSFPAKLESADLYRRLRTYFPTSGRTAGLATVVNVRSYFCISGRTSWLSDSGMSGMISCANSHTRASWAPLV